MITTAFAGPPGTGGEPPDQSSVKDPAESRAVCGERTWLPPELAEAARRLVQDHQATEDEDPADVEHRLHCTLERHTTGDHVAYVMDLDGRDTGSVWAQWIRGHAPSTVTVLPDCPTISPDTSGDSCCEYEGHPGAHTWQLTHHRHPAPTR